MEEIFSIIDELVSPSYCDLSDQQTFEFVDRFFTIYRVQSFRHSYHEIAKHLEMLNPEQRDVLEMHINHILDAADKTAKPSDREAVNRIAKLADHIGLEVIRMARMEKVKHIGDKAALELKEAQKSNKDAEMKSKNLVSQIDNYHSHSITILGIFSGIIVALFAGFQLSFSSLSNLDSINFYKIIIFILVLGIIIFDICFFMMYAISKIANKDISVRCKKHIDCESCRHKCYLINRLRRKYPYVFWLHLLVITVVIVIVMTKPPGFLA